ncbi:hypothetical protein [Streptomyces bottropensis]
MSSNTTEDPDRPVTLREFRSFQRSMLIVAATLWLSSAGLLVAALL